MAGFLNACIFCFGVSAVITVIVGHEDALALAILAIAAVVFRVARGKVGRKWINTKSRHLSELKK